MKFLLLTVFMVGVSMSSPVNEYSETEVRGLLTSLLGILFPGAPIDEAANLLDALNSTDPTAILEASSDLAGAVDATDINNLVEAVSAASEINNLVESTDLTGLVDTVSESTGGGGIFGLGLLPFGKKK